MYASPKIIHRSKKLPLRILIHDRPGHPFEVQLSRELAKHGHEVMHSFGAFFQSPRGALNQQPDDPPTFNIVGLQLNEPFAKYSFGKRMIQEIKYSQILLDHIRSFGPDVVIFANTPSEALSLVYWQTRRENIQFIFWVQDFYSIAVQKILSKRLSILGRAVGQLYVWMDKYLLKKSEQIVLITKDFEPLLEDWHVDLSKTTIIPNWAPLEDMPVCEKNNEWSITQQLEDKFCFLYSGTLGMKHNPALLVELAQQFIEQPDVRVVVISEGIGADWLQTQQSELQLNNLILLDYQPFAELPNVLGMADVLVAILEPDAGVFSVPSKVLSYLCAKRPLLLAVPQENLAARIVIENEAGLVVDPDDAGGFLENATTLFADGALRDRLSKNGRTYAEAHFDIKKISNQFEKIIISATEKS